MMSSTGLPPRFAACVLVFVWSCMSGPSECGACENTEPQPPVPVQGWPITAQGDVNLNCGDFANKEELQITLASCCTEFKVPEVNETTCCSALEGTLRYDGATKRIVFCNGQEWKTLAIDEPAGKGLSQHNPAMSCREIYLSGSYVSGLYWIRTDHHSTVPTQTGNQPNYPHVGLGWTGQQITWGYDLNTSPHGHWGNWFTSSCCLTGNTADIRDAGNNWRYSILIR
uniref:Fibrinogen C-terminal domain-containing protein n=1 Tax=Branchiostoma floridae TaxID=7739 RepID=C3YWB4_BRAFL|eukprot:XP_002599431.1 hypothetical protein BRAFLDRAFT_106574 [Branchiostoma floridae]